MPTTVPDVRCSMRATRSRWDAIVVGSGVGGTATAALLARHGKRVLVLDKNPTVGGILASVQRDGFKMDVGSHLVARGARGPIGRLLRDLSLTEPRFLTSPIPVRARGLFDATAPAHRRELPRVGLDAARRLGVPARDIARLSRLMLHIMTLTPPELRAWDRRSLESLLRRYTDHPGAYVLFAFLASIFFVLPPREVAASEAILALRHVIWNWSLSYLEGGMDRLPNALLGVVTAHGGEVVVSAPVVSIRRHAGLLQVSTAAGDVFEAPSVAANLAPIDLLALVDDEIAPEWASHAREIRPSGNAHQLKIGLSRRLVDEGCLIGGLSVECPSDVSLSVVERMVADIDAGRATDPMAFYVPVPTNFDPSLAPPGCQLLVASVYGPTCDEPVDPPEVWRDRALRALAGVVPGLMEALLFAELTPIATVGAWMGKSSHAAICNGQRPGQVGRDRLPVRTPIPGLVLCGDGAGGRGIGLELAATSAREAVRALR